MTASDLLVVLESRQPLMQGAAPLLVAARVTTMVVHEQIRIYKNC